MDDLISRQAAIDAINTIGRTSNWRAAMAVTLAGLPSAQPTQSNTTQCVQSVGSVGNLIDRQDAIDALGERPYLWTGGDYELGCVNQYDSDRLAIETVQPAQLEMHDKHTETHECDLISRQAAIDAVIPAIVEGADAEMVEGLLYLVPPAQQWIPVSSGLLPKAEHGEGEDVLCQLENMRRIVLYFDGGNWCYPSGEPYNGVNYKNGWSNKVVAWRELPKPYSATQYKGESNG